MKFHIFFFSFLFLVANIRCMEVAAQPSATDKKNPKHVMLRSSSIDRIKKSALLEHHCPGAVMNPRKERPSHTLNSKDPNSSAISHLIARSRSDEIPS